MLRVAVLMSTYNGERYIEEQIDSILAQQGDFTLDIWVRDDGSSDGTCTILQRYADEDKLRWYTGANLKPARSFLDLVKHCTGYDYYAFADQDDYWHTDKLQQGIHLLEGCTTPAMNVANAALVDGDLRSLGRNVYNRAPNGDFYSVLCGGGLLGCTVIFNQALAEILQTYHCPKTLIMHDSYAAVLCTLFDGRIFFDPQPHMDYRQHGANVVGAQWTKWAAVKNRFARITRRGQISIADMAQSILDQEPQPQDKEKLRFLQQVATYRKSPLSAVRLALSRKPKYNSRNMAITMRLSILLRNR